MKKAFILFLIIFLISLAVLGFYYIKNMKEKQLSKIYKEDAIVTEKKEKEKKVEIYEVKEQYFYQKDDFFLSFIISSSIDNSFSGKIQVYYIEDLYKEVFIVKRTWDVNGKRNKENEWNIRLSENKYDNYTTKAHMKENQISFEKLPILGEQDFTLSFKQTFDTNIKLKELDNLLNEKREANKINRFVDIESSNLPTSLNSFLSNYPINSDNSLTTEGKTKLYIHSDYLYEISNRIEINFTEIENELAITKKYIKESSPEEDPYFKDNVQKHFNKLIELNEENEIIIGYYNELVSFYEYPSTERDSSFDFNDIDTEKLFNDLIKKYSRTKINEYNTKIGELKQQSDLQYDEFIKKINP